ncbi:MAG: adenosylhomocysteinase [Candidatus Omnitrophota bacterium]|nr:MAG: adenosylhomocysteinase [Candidatus Omnitrophota bacterium]
MKADIKDISLAKKGRERIEWARENMPVLTSIGEEFRIRKPLEGVRIACCLHITSETANLLITLKQGGAKPFLCASNPLSTQDDIAASLLKDYKIPVFGIKGEDKKTYYAHLRTLLEQNPQITMDDGADLTSTLHFKEYLSLSEKVWGGTEETTTGVVRLRAMEARGVLRYPVIAVNNAKSKYLFDNRYGTGQSTIDGILRATNVLLAGSNFVVCGYGWCGKGLAMRAKGMGARVFVCEIDPLRALEAVMDGFYVLPLKEASKIGDIFITLTGDINVLREEHFLRMKDNVLVGNAGHFNCEIDLQALERLTVEKKRVRDFVQQYRLKNGKRINLLTEGRLVNLSAGEGHPAMVMDMSFANQALSVEFLLRERGRLNNKVYDVPAQIDERVARLKLKTMGVKIDSLTSEQREYLRSWEEGTR